jgi:hypothetical protein
MVRANAWLRIVQARIAEEFWRLSKGLSVLMPSEVSTVAGDQSVEELRREPAEAREQQAATAEILAAISNSPTDPSRVFTEIAARAARLCDAYEAVIFQVDGALLRLVAHEGPVSLGPVGQFTGPLVRGSLTGRVTLERRTIQLADHQAEEAEYPEGVPSLMWWNFFRWQFLRRSSAYRVKRRGQLAERAADRGCASRQPSAA